MILANSINKVLDTARIEEVVGDYVKLTRRGANLLGLCPFHNERTPSFTVSPVKGIYKCFGCAKGGDSIRFIMDLEGLSYPEAIRHLAKKYGIELEETEANPAFIEQKNERESLLIVCNFAQKYFANNLNETEEGKAIGFSYFKERGFSVATIEKFGLGYALEQWSHFAESALTAGYNLENAEKAGLIISEGKTKAIDRYRGRVIFPIHSASGQVIAFAGRVLKSDSKTAKYVNSPETPIYHKSKVLYGLHWAKKSISEQDLCLLVEGYTDVISLHQSGVENVISSSGTSLTTEQIKLISRYTKNVSILYDGDAAGIKASMRGVDMILEQGLNVKIVLFPDGHDPDSYSKTVGSSQLQAYIKEHAQDFITYKTHLLLQEAGNDPIKKAALIRSIVETVALIPDVFIRQQYVKLCSNLLEISEQILVSELNKTIKQKHQKPEKSQHVENTPDKSEVSSQNAESPISLDEDAQEKDLLRILINYGDRMVNFGGDENSEEISVAVAIASLLAEDEALQLTSAAYQKVLIEVNKAIAANQPPDLSFFIQHPDREIANIAISLSAEKYELSDNWEHMHKIFVNKESDPLQIGQTVIRSYQSFKLRKLNLLIKEKQNELKNVEDHNQISATLATLKRLDEVKKVVSKVLGITIIK